MSETDPFKRRSLIDLISFKIFSYFTDYKKILFLVVPFFFLCSIIIFKFSSSNAEKEADFLSAKNAFVKWEEENNIESENFKTLKHLLKKHPELKPFYESGIVQQCLVFGQIKEAEPFIKDLFSRKSTLLSSYYSRFSEGTVLIAKQEYGRAYEEALLLKQDLLSDTSFWESQKHPHYGSVLFVFNLLRIGMISQQLGKKDEELSAWNELKKYGNWDGKEDNVFVNFDRQACEILVDHFSEQSLSIKDYIKYRERIILQ